VKVLYLDKNHVEDKLSIRRVVEKEISGV